MASWSSNLDGVKSVDRGVVGPVPADGGSGSSGAGGDYQGRDGDLTALAGLDATAGILVKTGENAYARRSLALSAEAGAVMSVSNPAGTAGNPTIDLEEQNPNTVLAGPESGTADSPTFRGLVDADIPGAIARDSEVTAAVATREPALGNPDVDGKVLSSTAAGARSWVAPGTTPADASELVKGIVELATAAETATGTDDTRAVHPAGAAATYAKLGAVTTSNLTMATGRLLGRTTAATGAVEEISAGTSLSLASGSLNTIQDIRTTATPQFERVGIGTAADATAPLKIGTLSGLLLLASGASSVVVFDEGVFTPTMGFATPGDLSVAYTAQNGAYTRIGSQVFFSLVIGFIPTFTTSSGVMEFYGLPFTASSTAPNARLTCIISTGTVTFDAGRTWMVGFTVAGTQTVRVATYGSGVAASVLGAAHITTGVTRVFILTGFYTA